MGQLGKKFYAIAAAAMLASGGASAAEGAWINLYDGESTFGWTNVGDVQWSVAEGVLTGEDGNGGWLAHNAVFKDFELSATIKIDGPGSLGLAVRAPMDGHTSENGAAVVTIANEEREGAWHEVVVRAEGNAVTATIDGTAVEGLATSNAKGHIGIQYHRYHKSRGRGPKIELKEMKLRPLGVAPIFNGENLDGWNIIPDRKSEFSVSEGALKIVNGNGQIETDALYRDFILQLDVISNGDKLNSGVFFRGPKGVFWKGYESQLRNEWQRDDRTKPVDFGTGGIYGVQETRKVIPSDYEWFSKTIVADGPHMAVWINGYQVSDFFDTRAVSPEKDGKNGYVPDAGTIHLQGHDPTTNLSFKNIHLQSYDE